MSTSRALMLGRTFFPSFSKDRVLTRKSIRNYITKNSFYVSKLENDLCTRFIWKRLYVSVISNFPLAVISVSKQFVGVQNYLSQEHRTNWDHFTAHILTENK